MTMPHGDLLQSNIRTKLGRLRGALRRRLATEGLAVLGMALVAAVFVTLGFDYMLRLDRPLRLVLMLAALSAVAAVVWRGLVLPLRVAMSDEDLALLAERAWGKLDDRLISAIQFSHIEQWPPGSSAAMLERMAQEANALAADLPFSQLIERRALRRRLALCFCSLGLLGGFAAWTAPYNTINLWFQRNVLLRDIDWPQKTYLTVQGGPDFSLLRGDDLVVSVTVQDDSTAPEAVVFHADYPSVGKAEEAAKVNADGRSYDMKFQAVSEEFSFYVTGGDDRRDRQRLHHVHLIDPPALRDVKFSIAAPAYMNINETPFEPAKGVLTVPLGSTVNLQAAANKDIASATILLDDEPIATARVAPGSPRSIVGSFTIGGANKPASHTLRIALSDTAGYASRKTQQFMVQVQADLAPSVELKSRGIGSVITPNADIPLTLQVRDDYGVAAATVWVELPTKAASKPTTSPTSSPATAVQPAPTGQRDFQATHHCDLDALGLKPSPGDTLVITAQARDTFDESLGGANVKAASIELRVVTPDEVRADLTRRQKEISLEFAQAVLVQATSSANSSSAAGELSAGAAPTDVQARLADASRGQLAVGGECSKSAGQLQTIYEEMVNNRVFSSNEHQELANEIIAPLKALAGPIEQAAADLTKAAKLAEQGSAQAAATKELTAAAAAAQQKILEQMKAILTRMQKLESRQDIINQVEALRNVWGKVLTQTKDLEKKQVGNIFDSAGTSPSTRPAEKPPFGVIGPVMD